jgi:prophage antirepressor-like protein
MPEDAHSRTPGNDLDLFTSAGDGLQPEHFGIDEHGRAYVQAPPFAKALDYRDAANALRILSDDEKGTHIVSTPGGDQRVSVIFEDGIWELIFRSTKPSAKAIKAKVKAILRQLRETGLVDLRQQPLTEIEVARRYVAALERNEQLEQTVAEQAPMVAQAEAHRAGYRDITRQEFAREVVTWAEEHGVRVLHRHVFEFLAHIGLFIAGDRADAGHAKTDAIRAGLARTEKGTTERGRNYATGKLTPKGQGYAWDRITRHIEANGTLDLPRQIGA